MTFNTKLRWFGGVHDPYWPYVKLLMHMNGANNGTSFPDKRNHTITPVGNVITSTATKKFGTASALFDGSGDQLQSPHSTDWDFGTGNFTIELWTNATANLSRTLIAKGITTTSNLSFALEVSASASQFRSIAKVSFSGTGLDVNLVGTQNLALASFAHIAFVRNGNDFLLFQNGTLVASTTAAGSIFVGSGVLSIGAAPNGTSYFQGNIDDLRITKGIARYTANFSVPTRQFPDA